MTAHIQDALHGYIELSDEEKRIIDRPEFQRLRRIKQMGLTPMVYPSATHTRFQHSLGVMHVAGRFAESLGLNEERKRELRLAGLLHDIGHGPFSHASEAVAEKHGVSHEDLSCNVIAGLEDEIPADIRRVNKIIKGDLEIGRVVAGDIDADRMDYLRRDAHSTGVKYGYIDADTIIRLAEIDSRRLVFDYKGVQALESLLTARFHMIKSVYLHKASVIAEKMLERALENYTQSYSIEEMMQLDDYTAHVELKNFETGRGLYSRASDRDLYKQALKLDEDKLTRERLKKLSDKNEKSLENKISSECGLERSDVIVNLPSIPSSKELNVRVKKDKVVRDLSEISPIPSALTEAQWNLVNLSVYASRENVSKVEAASKKLLL